MGGGEKVYWKQGDIKEVDGKIELCNNGIHFFRYLCFAINYFDNTTHVFRIQSLGDVVEDTEKCITICSSEWNKQQGSCIEVFNIERSNGWMPSSTDSNTLDCSESLPTFENDATCQCKCVCAGLTSNFLI